MAEEQVGRRSTSHLKSVRAFFSPKQKLGVLFAYISHLTEKAAYNPTLASPHLIYVIIKHVTSGSDIFLSVSHEKHSR